MELELFQLESLILSRAPFLLLDLREAGGGDAHLELQKLLQSAVRVPSEDVEKYLENGEKSRPVVLLCENGERSTAMAQRLETAGYSNVYVVAEGEAGLRSELERTESLSSSTK